MIKRICKNKKGFTLPELLVTLAILGMVVVMASQLMSQFLRTFNTTETRYEIQSAVSLASRKFETNRDSLVYAYQADLLYDPAIAEGVIIDEENGTFQWKGELPRTLPAEGAVKEENGNPDPFTYMFSAPAYKPDGTYLGSYLFIREFNTANSVLFLDAEGMGDVPVEIAFRIAKSAPLLDESGNPLPNNETTYLPQTVEIELKSGLPEVTNYSMITQYALINVDRRNRDINYIGRQDSGRLIYESEWADGTSCAAGPAGWTDSSLSNYPNPVTTFEYTPAGSTDPVDTAITVTTVQNDGNVMRFISPSAFKTIPDAGDLTSGANLASCLTSFAFSDSSKLSSHVLGSLRDFRDNVLAGTTVGDWVIHEYYNTWSPFLVEKAGFLKPVYRIVLVPVSYVCGFVANL